MVQKCKYLLSIVRCQGWCDLDCTLKTFKFRNFLTNNHNKHLRINVRKDWHTASFSFLLSWGSDSSIEIFKMIHFQLMFQYLFRLWNQCLSAVKSADVYSFLEWWIICTVSNVKQPFKVYELFEGWATNDLMTFTIKKRFYRKNTDKNYWMMNDDCVKFYHLYN